MPTALSPAKGRVATTRPPIPSGRPLEDRFFTDETVPGARDGTIVDQVWFNTVSVILRSVIRAGGVTPDDANADMLLQAISALALGEAEGMAIDASRIISGQLDPARIPVLAADTVVISSGDLTALTAPQQAAIATGTIVATTDGQRWIYKGTGSKTDSASYITLADVTPDWSMITGKPVNQDYRIAVAPPIKSYTADVTLAKADTGSLIQLNGGTTTITTMPDNTTGQQSCIYFIFNTTAVAKTLKVAVNNFIYSSAGVSGSAGTFTLQPNSCCLIMAANWDWHVFEIRKVGTSANSVVALDASGRLPPVDGSQLTGLGTSWPDGALKGLELSSPSTTTVGIAVGSCRNEDAGTPRSMILASAITKGLGAWAAGTGNGGLDTGAIAASTWYHVHLIRKDSDGTLDALISLSKTAPTMPSGYTARRCLGSIRTNGSSQVTPFTQVGDHFMWDSPVADATGSVSSSAAQLVVLSVPPVAGIEADFQFTADSSTFGYVLVSSPLTSDLAPSSTVAPYFTVIAASSNSRGCARLRIATNASGQIRHRNTATASTTITIVTYGWYDNRGRV